MLTYAFCTRACPTSLMLLVHVLVLHESLYLLIINIESLTSIVARRMKKPCLEETGLQVA